MGSRSATVAVAALALLSGNRVSAQDCALAQIRCVGAGKEYSTIQAAADVVTPGDTVDVFDGTYEPFVVTRSGTRSQPITFRAVNKRGARITTSKSSNGHRAAIMVFLADYVTIDGFKVDLSGTKPGPSREHAIACYGWEPFQKGCVIRNNEAAGARVANIFTAFSEGVLIEDNVARDSEDEHGIYVSNSADHPIIRRNLTYDNHGAGVQINADKFSPPGDGNITGAVVDSNVIHGNSIGCAAALSLDGVQDSIVENNLLYENGCQSVTATCVDGASGPRNMVFVNNTVIVPAGAGSRNWAIKIEGDAVGRTDCPDQGGHVLFNNVLLRTDGNTGSISIQNGNVKSDYNRLSDRLRRNGTTVGLAAWQGHGYDPHSTVDTAAGLFVASATADYHLRPGSSALDAGVASFSGTAAPSHDVAGQARPRGSGFDIGAYEGGTGTQPSTPTKQTDRR